jgi:hypothetical protein
MAKFDAFAVDTVVLLDEDRVMISKLVAKSADEQAGYSATDDERRKEKIAMWWHATRRSFDEGAFCEGDEKWWTAYVNEGLVFDVAKAAKLWSGGQFRFTHIVETQMFQEAQPSRFRDALSTFSCCFSADFGEIGANPLKNPVSLPRFFMVSFRRWQIGRSTASIFFCWQIGGFAA